MNAGISSIHEGKEFCQVEMNIVKVNRSAQQFPSRALFPHVKSFWVHVLLECLAQGRDEQFVVERFVEERDCACR